MIFFAMVWLYLVWLCRDLVPIYVRAVLPGYFATYWRKHVCQEVLTIRLKCSNFVIDFGLQGWNVCDDHVAKLHERKFLN